MMKMTKAEQAIYRLGQVSKLAMALRQAGRASRLKSGRAAAVREKMGPWGKEKSDEAAR